MTDSSLVHVLFKVNAEVMNALLGGYIKIYFSLVPTVLQHVRTGTFRELSINSTRPEFS